MKLTVDNFKDRKTIDAIVGTDTETQLPTWDTSDDNGYTPLCFASLNCVRPDLIVYMLNKGRSVLNVDQVCNKGKSALQLACMAMSSNSISALIGSDVVSYDDSGNIEYTTDNQHYQPDPTGTYIYVPERDANDNIKFQELDTAREYNYRDLGGNTRSVYISKGGTYFGDTPRCDKLHGDFADFKMPLPILRNSEGVECDEPNYNPTNGYVQLKWDADKNPVPMRDHNDKPIKMPSNTSKDGYLHVTEPIYNDEHEIVGYKEIPNKFVYVQYYEAKPEWKTFYDPVKVHAPDGNKASVTDNDILAAANSPTGDCLSALIEMYQGDFNNILSSENYIPLCLATKMQCYDSVDLILKKYSNRIAASIAIMYMCGTGNNKESAFSVATSLGDNGILAMFNEYPIDTSSDVFKNALKNAFKSGNEAEAAELLTFYGDKIYDHLSDRYFIDEDETEEIYVARFINSYDESQSLDSIIIEYYVDSNTSCISKLVTYGCDRLLNLVSDKVISYNTLSYVRSAAAIGLTIHNESLPSKMNGFVVGSTTTCNSALSEIDSFYYCMYNFEESQYNSPINTWMNPDSQSSSTLPFDEDVSFVKIGSNKKYTECIITNGSSDSSVSPLYVKINLDDDTSELIFDFKCLLSAQYDIVNSSKSAAVVNVNDTTLYGFHLPDDLYIKEGTSITWNEDHALYKLLSGKHCFGSTTDINP